MSSAQESTLPPLKPSRDLDVINKRLLDLRNSKCHLIGPGVKSQVKMETLPEGYEVSWHCFLFDPRPYIADGIPGPDVYRDPIWPAGQVALKRQALLELWSSADGRYVHSQREDDGRDPHYARYAWAGSVLSISGTPRPEAYTKEMDLREGSAQVQGMKEGMKRQQRANISQLCESKAQNRAIRALLGIAQTYREDEVGWPFVLMKLVFVPDMRDPMIRMLVTANAIGAASALFGGPSGQELMKALMAPRPEADESPALPPAPSIPRQLAEVKPSTLDAIAQGEGRASAPIDPKPQFTSELPFSIEADKPKPESEPKTDGLIHTLADYERLEAHGGAGSVAIALAELLTRYPEKAKKVAMKEQNFANWEPRYRKQFVEYLLAPEKNGN